MGYFKLPGSIKRNEFINRIIDSFIGKGSHIILTLLFSLVCTRLYGVEIFGEFTFYYTILSLAMLAATAGMNNGLIYTIPKFKYKYLSFSLLLNIIFSLIIIFILMQVFPDKIFLYMLPMVWLLSMEQIFLGVYQATGNIKGFYKIFGFWSMLLRVLLVVFMYYLFGSNSIIFIVFSVYVSLFFANFVYIYNYKRAINKLKIDSFFIKFSLPLMFTSIMAAVINKIDIIMLGNMTSSTEVGVYQITFQIANTLSVILLIFNTVFAPTISNLFHQNKLERLKKLYVKSTRILAIIALGYIIIILLLGKIILYIFGAELVSGYLPLVYRSIGQFINVAVGSVWFMISMTGNTKPQMFANFFAMIINIILNYIFIPLYGINGAAFASMVSLIFLNIIGYIIVSRKFQIKAFKFF